MKLSQTKNIPLRNIHIVGHSLGAHIAGFTGKTINTSLSTKLGRITGLDPAGPGFSGFLVTDDERLNRNDAEIVLVIHTDQGKFGYMGPCGTTDIYANGGFGLQPGCPEFITGDIGIEIIVSANLKNILFSVFCSHRRSFRYYIEALKNEGKLIATQCVSYSFYRSGKCSSNEKIDLGNHILSHGNFYLTTNAVEPFGRGGKL